MGKLLTLDTSKMTSSFFEDSRIFGIKSQSPVYKLCWLLNESLNMRFSRDLDDDIKVNDIAFEASLKGTLFDSILARNAHETYFPVYRYHPGRQLSNYNQIESSAAIILYANKSGNQTLIPEMNYADYIIVFQCADFLCEDLMKTRIKQLTEISWVGELSVSSLKSRRNLII